LLFLGFSQDAALGFASAMQGERPVALISAAGFLSQGALERRDFFRKAHWNIWLECRCFEGMALLDTIVSIDSVRRAVEELRVAGAHAAFCEAEVGYKLGLECLRGLKTWF